MSESQFKVGDRVRVLYRTTQDAEWIYGGVLGVVLTLWRVSHE